MRLEQREELELFERCALVQVCTAVAEFYVARLVAMRPGRELHWMLEGTRSA